MKKRLCLVIVMCLCLCLTCTGCNNTVEKKPQLDLYGDYFEDTLKVTVQIIAPPELRYRDIEDWESFLFDTFNLDLKLNYSSDIKEILKSNDEHEGLIYISSYKMLNDLIESNLLIPIDSTNFSGYFNNFSDKQKYSYSKYGSLYAIPVESRFPMEYRYYLAEYIEG